MIEKKYSKLDYRTIGDRIKTLRGSMKQIDFAALFGIEQQNVSKIERAKLKPSINLLRQISLHFNKPLEWLLEETAEIKPPTNAPTKEPSPSYPDPDPELLLQQTAKILRTNSSFRKALDSNIQAFHEAVTMREDLDVARAQLNECQILLHQQAQRIEHLEAELKSMRDKGTVVGAESSSS